MKSPLIQQANDALAHSSGEGLLMGTMTVIFLVFFVGWAVWAWLPANKDRMEAAARMPLDDGLPNGGEA